MSMQGSPPPLVSVIVATHNRAKLLPAALRSVLAQSFTDFELIVVDDGSVDGTDAVVASIPDVRLRYIQREKCGGVAAARNTGIRAAHGTYVAFNDSDDEWLLEKLERQVAAMRDNGPTCDMVVCGLLRCSRELIRRYPQSFDGWPGALTHQQVLGGALAYTQTWLVKREVLLAVGGFDEQMRVWSDWEMLIRLSARIQIRTIPAVLVMSDMDTQGLTAVASRFTVSMGYILRKHQQHLESLPEQLAAIEYRHARFLIRDGENKKAVLALRRSLGLRWRNARAWVLLLAALTGPLARRLIHAREVVARRKSLGH